MLCGATGTCATMLPPVIQMLTAVISPALGGVLPKGLQLASHPATWRHFWNIALNTTFIFAPLASDKYSVLTLLLPHLPRLSVEISSCCHAASNPLWQQYQSLW